MMDQPELFAYYDSYKLKKEKRKEKQHGGHDLNIFCLWY